MRTARTAGEQSALDALAEHLTAAGSRVDFDPSITDKPDAVLLLDGKRIACECRYIGPEGLLQFHGREWPENGCAHILIPWEPHMWATHGVTSKNANVGEYLARAGASDAWLILHTSHLLPLMLRKDSITRSLFTAGCAFARPRFSKIWLLDAPGQAERVWEIWNAESGERVPKKFDLHGDQYPFKQFWLGKTRVKASESGEKYVSVNLKNAAQYYLQPLDPRYSISYEVAWPKVVARARKIELRNAIQDAQQQHAQRRPPTG